MANSANTFVILFLITISLVLALYWASGRIADSKKKRRRWTRIKVPLEKLITCRIAEPPELAEDAEFIVDDINVAGIAFFSDRPLARAVVKLLVRFPFTTFKEASTVWGKIVYCNKMADGIRYRIGICYLRKEKRGTNNG